MLITIHNCICRKTLYMHDHTIFSIDLSRGAKPDNIDVILGNINMVNKLCNDYAFTPALTSTVTNWPVKHLFKPNLLLIVPTSILYYTAMTIILIGLMFYHKFGIDNEIKSHFNAFTWLHKTLNQKWEILILFASSFWMQSTSAIQYIGTHWTENILQYSIARSRSQVLRRNVWRKRIKMHVRRM